MMTPFLLKNLKAQALNIAGKRLCFGLLILTSFSALAEERFENRCGWLYNPTPANLWLIDNESQWILSTQGMPSAMEDDYDNIPEVNPNDFVRTNGSYGFSCACLSVIVNRDTHQVLRLKSGKSLPLKTCLEDPAIRHKIPIEIDS